MRINTTLWINTSHTNWDNQCSILGWHIVSRFNIGWTTCTLIHYIFPLFSFVALLWPLSTPTCYFDCLIWLQIDSFSYRLQNTKIFILSLEGHRGSLYNIYVHKFVEPHQILKYVILGFLELYLMHHLMLVIKCKICLYVILMIYTQSMYLYAREFHGFKPNSWVSSRYSLWFEVHLTPNVLYMRP